jgi:tetratricopeptide (TPR) repeat protein
MPEKSQNEIPACWQEMYEKGLTAYQRQNLDYAIPLFNQILEKEPGFYDCREALRAAQFKKAGAGSNFFMRALGKATSTGPLLARGRIALHSNPLEAIQLAEQILNQDPHSTMAHKLLADAALAADLPRTAVLSLEIVFKTAPRDRELALRLAMALSAAGQGERAEEILTDLQQSDPGNNEISQALKNLSVHRTMEEGGYNALSDGSGSYRDILKDKEQSKALEQENREVKTEDVATNLIQEYETRLAKEPKNLRLLRSLADLHAQKNDFDTSLAYYQRILDSGMGGDSSIDKSIADTHLKKFDFLESKLDPNAPDYAQNVAKLKADRQAFQLAECKSRADKFPSDLGIRFELGQLYYETGHISEAIQELQKSQNNPHRRVQSLFYLGQCFAKRGMNDLAARTLQNAIKEKVVFDDEKKELIYELGCVLEKMKKTEEAIEQFKQIYEVDIGYKDVAGKVDAYYASKG